MTQTQSSTHTTHECYPHYHMSAQEYGFYDVCRSLSFKTNVLYFNGPGIAARFRAMSKGTPYNLARSLESSGWLVLLKDSSRKRNGTFTPRQYRVLTHEEWTANHPGQCKQPSPENGMDENVSDTHVSPFPISDCPLPIFDQPLQKEGNNLLIKQPNKKQPRELLTNRPFQKEGMDVSIFLGKFSKSGRQTKTPKGQHVIGAPLQKEGMDVPDTFHTPPLPMDIASRALRLSTAITGALGITYPGVKQQWDRVTTNLMQQEYAEDAVRNAADLYMSNPNTRRAMMHPDHGAVEFEKAFPHIDQHLKQQQAAPQAEGEGVRQ